MFYHLLNYNLKNCFLFLHLHIIRIVLFFEDLQKKRSGMISSISNGITTKGINATIVANSSNSTFSQVLGATATVA